MGTWAAQIVKPAPEPDVVEEEGEEIMVLLQWSDGSHEDSEIHCNSTEDVWETVFRQLA